MSTVFDRIREEKGDCIDILEGGLEDFYKIY